LVFWFSLLKTDEQLPKFWGGVRPVPRFMGGGKKKSKGGTRGRSSVGEGTKYLLADSKKGVNEGVNQKGKGAEGRRR